jgi:hypothetical protein
MAPRDPGASQVAETWKFIGPAHWGWGGASGHTALAHLLHGSVVQQVVRNLPDEIAVVICG